MVKSQVKKIMKEALVRFGKENGVEASKVAIFIHTKSEDYEPMYFKTVSNVTEKNEDGTTKNLDFNKDILNVKFDLLARAYLTSNFMKSYFKTLNETEKIEGKNIYLKIGCSDLEGKDLVLVLYNNSAPLRKLTLDDVFGED